MILTNSEIAVLEKYLIPLKVDQTKTEFMTRVYFDVESEEYIHDLYYIWNTFYSDEVELYKFFENSLSSKEKS